MSGRFSPHCVLVTGGAGFIGSNLVRWLLTNEPDLVVINLDFLTYAGNLENLTDVEAQYASGPQQRYHFVHGDVRDAEVLSRVLAGDASDARGASMPRPDAAFHLAAESHVDRSIMEPSDFVSTNVEGTLSLLRVVRAELESRPREFRLINVSTDEVYGSLGPTDPAFTERTALAPNSPYAASKAAADCLVRAYAHTYGLPCITTRCSNNYGPFQFPEKLIPLIITRALGNQELPVYGDGLQIRDWLHVSDHAAALWAACTIGKVRDEVYNFGGACEWTNLSLVKRLLHMLGKPDSLIKYVPDRLGHDRRYAMNISRTKQSLGWRPTTEFDEGLEATVEWYLSNQRWWKRVQSEAYRAANTLYLNRSPVTV